MNRALFSGVSGLKVHQTRMDVIGNNISNVNTIGFKGSRTTFSDMLSQLQSGAAAPTTTRGGVNPRQIGLGVSVESIDLVFTDSSPQQTGRNTDLALSGNGLFVLKAGDQEYYTRNGGFAFDEQGYYVMPGNGLRVQGWNANADGIINTNGLAEDIVVPVNKTMEATSTTQIAYSGNFDKETLMIASITYTEASGGDDSLVTTTATDTSGNLYTSSVNVDGTNVMAAQITLTDGSTINVTSGYYEVGKSIPVTTLATVYDSLGGKHQVTLLLDKDNVTTTDNPSADAEATATRMTYTTGGVTYPVTYDGTNYTYTDANGNTQTVQKAQVTFIYDNRWRVYIAPGEGVKGPADTSFANSFTRTEADGSTIEGTMNRINYLYFNDRGQFVTNTDANNTGASITFTYSDGNGASDQQSTIDFTGLTQYANSTTVFPTTDGNTAGTLQGISIDSNGIITGSYTNGLVRNEAQIAVAQFSNSSGLNKVGSTIYQKSNNSGEANIKTLADFGMTAVASALEMSNVDLATEFSEMIITQRGFQANSKVTTVSDEMLETVVNMKR
ncbi:MAG: flagellar hook-basal body complex protein [Selenomonadaceae bacterium]|nr:flagellar hook-basal body complex protein [Selenomonadaceae bacterium]